MVIYDICFIIQQKREIIGVFPFNQFWLWYFISFDYYFKIKKNKDKKDIFLVFSELK